MSTIVISKVKAKKEEFSKSINKLFKDIIEEYFPGGFFKWEDHAKEIINKFHSIAYNIVRKYLPKKLFDKIKDLDLPQIFSESDIKIDDELINRIVLDSIVNLNENPDLLKEYLIRTLHGGREDDVTIKVGDVFFIPKIGHEELEEVRNIRPDAKVGEIDSRVLDRLEGLKEIKWTWKGIDENGFLKFTLPELYGERIFSVRLPKEVPTIKPGTYTFNVKKIIPKKGVVLNLKEQTDQIKKISLDTISEEGMGKDQLINFIYKAVIGFLNEYITKRPVEKVLEDLAGTVSIKGEQISSVEDLAELSGLGEKEEERKIIKKREEEVKKYYEESLEEERKKLQEMMNRWFKAPEVVRFFSKQQERGSEKVVKAVAEKFPEKSEKKVVSLASVIQTRPVVEMVLRYIMSPHTPPATQRKAPWITLAWDSFKKMALNNPTVKESIKALIKGKEEQKEVTDKDIHNFLNSISTNTINKVFFDLKEKIANIINEAEKTGEVPELKPFYDYRKIFKEYTRRLIGPYLEKYVEEKGLSPDNPEDREKIENFFKKKMDLLSDVVGGKKSVKDLFEKIEKYSSVDIINKLIRQCMSKINRGVL